MKIVINKCYGGFSLSKEAEKLYAKKSGFNIFRYEQTKYKHKDGNDLFEKVNDASCCLMSFTFKKDRGESFEVFGNDDSYWYSSDVERNDTLLVEVVEELGNESSGSCANLEVVEIPDDVQYQMMFNIRLMNMMGMNLSTKAIEAGKE